MYTRICTYISKCIHIHMYVSRTYMYEHTHLSDQKCMHKHIPRAAGACTYRFNTRVYAYKITYMYVFTYKFTHYLQPWG